jgi:UPF0271 protein
MFRVDLNCDMGESYGVYRIGNDAELIRYVSAVNIACGFHGGDPSTIRKTVRLALDHGVAVGAHPGLPDLAGFGRRPMEVSPEEVYDMVIYQIGALYGFVKSEGGQLHHVKPHGALYNMAATDRGLSEAIARAVYRVDPGLVLYGLSGSELIRAGQQTGLRTASETFADRSYRPDGTLTPRQEAGALIDDAERAADQVLRMVLEGKVVSCEGEAVNVQAETVCIHGDSPRAVELARRIRERCEAAGVIVQPF